MRFDPREFMECDLGPLTRPKFLPIVSSNTLATTMLKKANGRVDGLVIETRTAGGHNAPPRGKPVFSEIGEPVYGERDAIDIAKLRELGVPFWLAGGYGSAEMLREALEQGAAGVQVGTAFEFTNESGLRADYKRRLLAKAIAGQARVFTDPLASPTGFPFKVAQLEGTCSDADGRRRTSAHLRPELPEGAVPDSGGRHRLSLRLRAGQLSLSPRAARWKIPWAESASAMD